MIVEIKGTQFSNKGAELMLHAILNKIREEFPCAKIVLSPAEFCSYLDRAKVGAYQKIWFSKCGYPISIYLEKIIHRKIKDRYGLIGHSDVDVILDASGFAYSDQWGRGELHKTAISYEYAKKNGALVIVLPQALGPFEQDGVKVSALRMLSSCDLIFPRDELSKRYVDDIVGSKSSVTQSPDFTCLQPGLFPKDQCYFEDKICVIPNSRMLGMSSKEDGAAYIPYLANIIEIIKYRARDCFILLHEDGEDQGVADYISNKLDTDIDIISEKCPLRIKGIIGSSYGVISSRYHGIVSALTQGKIALATSWSHKYQLLFDEFGFSDGVLNIGNNSEINHKLDYLLCPEKKEAMEKLLKERALLYREKAIVMWDTVFDLIRGSAKDKMQAAEVGV